MTSDKKLADLTELYIEDELSPDQANELLDVLHKHPKATGVFRDLLATDYHLREAYHTRTYGESLKEGVAAQLGTANGFVDSTMARVRELGERWGAEERERSSLGALGRLIAAVGLLPRTPAGSRPAR